MSFNGITHSFTNMEYIYYSKVAHFFRNVHCNAHIVCFYNDIICIKASFLPHCNRFVTSVGLTEYRISAFFNFYRMMLVKLDNCKTILYWKSHLILKTEKELSVITIQDYINCFTKQNFVMPQWNYNYIASNTAFRNMFSIS